MSNQTEDQRLTPELKAKWLQALRSGEYQQARGKLQDDGAYCCFGVLLRVAGYTDEQIGSLTTISQVSGSLGKDVCSSEDDYELRVTLENMNDGREGQRKHSFTEIADYIEKHL